MFWRQIWLGFFVFLHISFSLDTVGSVNTVPPSGLMRPGLGARTAWHLYLLCGWSAGMFTQSLFGVIVGLCGIVFLLNVLPDGVVLTHSVISPSPVASFSSLPRLVLPVLLTEDVLATESRWFAILSDSGAEAKPSPTASVMGIKSR